MVRKKVPGGGGDRKTIFNILWQFFQGVKEELTRTRRGTLCLQ
jgi:hypothetical protein